MDKITINNNLCSFKCEHLKISIDPLNSSDTYIYCEKYNKIELRTIINKISGGISFSILKCGECIAKDNNNKLCENNCQYKIPVDVTSPYSENIYCDKYNIYLFDYDGKDNTLKCEKYLLNNTNLSDNKEENIDFKLIRNDKEKIYNFNEKPTDIAEIVNTTFDDFEEKCLGISHQYNGKENISETKKLMDELDSIYYEEQPINNVCSFESQIGKSMEYLTLSIVYNEKTNHYMWQLSPIHFRTINTEISCLEDLLNQFTTWMINHEYNTNLKTHVIDYFENFDSGYYYEFTHELENNAHAFTSIEKLYSAFKLIANGFISQKYKLNV